MDPDEIENITLLLVEDNRSDAEITIRTLKSVGFLGKILHSTTAEESWVLIEDQVTRFRDDLLPLVILLDIGLPGMSGLHLLDKIRSSALTCRIPVIILSGYDKDQDLFDGYSRGTDSYITKPLDADDARLIKDLIVEFRTAHT